MGRTRAAALTAIAGGCTTSALARRVGISNAGASQHTSVLRRSGLITTVRDGSSVVHDLTPLGRSLLAGSDLGPPPSSDGMTAGPLCDGQRDVGRWHHPFSVGLTMWCR